LKTLSNLFMFKICNCTLYLCVESQSDPTEIIWIGLLRGKIKIE